MLKWVGADRGLVGLPNVPGRDLSEKEIERLGLDREALLATGLYKESKPKKKKAEKPTDKEV